MLLETMIDLNIKPLIENTVWKHVSLTNSERLKMDKHILSMCLLYIAREGILPDYSTAKSFFDDIYNQQLDSKTDCGGLYVLLLLRQHYKTLLSEHQDKKDYYDIKANHNLLIKIICEITYSRALINDNT